jgi:multidrug efflux system outer membrane protein
MKSNGSRILVLGMIAVLLGGCTLAPKYQRPASPVPSGWPTGAAYQGVKPDEPALTAVAELPWREFLPEKRLQKVIETALNNSRDLRLPTLNVERARALYGVQRAELLPVVDVMGSGLKERVPADLSSSGHSTTREVYSVDLGVTAWEIDFFGRIRSLKDRALQEYLATDQARRNARILLVSEVANVWFAMAADAENLKLSRSTLEAQQASYGLIRKRYDVGLSSELDLRRAQTQVDTARRNVAVYTQLTAQDENALNLLVGTPLPGNSCQQAVTVFSPEGDLSRLSSEVLLNRPRYVLAAEHRLKSGPRQHRRRPRCSFFSPASSLTPPSNQQAPTSPGFSSPARYLVFSRRSPSRISMAAPGRPMMSPKVERDIS